MKKIFSLTVLSLALLATTSSVFAQSSRRGSSRSGDPAQAICTTKAEFVRNIKDDTIFLCTGGLPNLTFAQILSRGYRVLQLSSYSSEDANYHYLDHAIVIEKK